MYKKGSLIFFGYEFAMANLIEAVMTSSEIKYLISIIALDKKGAVRQSDIANYMGCSKPSVTRATDKLEFQGYIKKDSYIKLTQKGIEKGEKLIKIQRYLQKLILQNLSASVKAAQRDSLEIMGVLSSCNLEKLYELSIKE